LQFQEDPNKIKCDPINFQQYEEFAERLTEDDLRRYIQREADRFKNERLEELAEMDKEVTNLQGTIDSMEQQAVQLD
jgi:predicted transcriptional regulator